MHLSELSLHLENGVASLTELQFQLLNELLCALQLSLLRCQLLGLPCVVFLRLEQLALDLVVFISHSTSLRLNTRKIGRQAQYLLVLQKGMLAQGNQFSFVTILLLLQHIDFAVLQHAGVLRL